MDVMSIGDIAKAGMNSERSRVELASMRLALVSTGYSSVNEAKAAAQSVSAQQFAQAVGIETNTMTPSQDIPIKTIHDPAHPNADGTGNVYFLDLDPIHEMATLVSALRAYEANVRAYNTNSEMTRSALSIGGSQ